MSEAKEPETSPETKATKSAEVLSKIEVHAKPLIAFLTSVTPVVITFCQNVYSFFKILPDDELQFMIGAVLCFFGGVYPTLFAAIEAAKHGGLMKVKKALEAIADEATKIIDASKKDDEKDDDNNGIKDVDELDAKQLLARKANLVLTKMDPQKVNEAISSIYTVWLAVVAVLTIKFAQTIALAISMSTYLNRLSRRFVIPNVVPIIPKEYHKWIPVVIDWITKAICTSIAFYLTSIVIAVSSAMTGALIMARAMVEIANKRGWTFDGMVPKDHNESYVDEAASYVLGFMGFWFQWKLSFAAPFPLNLLLFPFEFAEQYIRSALVKM